MLDEFARIRALHSKGVLDTEAEARFDRIVAMASRYFDAPIALVSLVDTDRQFFKARTGLNDRQTPREWAICDHAIALGPNQVMVVEDASLDPRFAHFPSVTGSPNIRFYAGATLTTEDGANLGTLCVIDTEPRPRPSPTDLAHLQGLAQLVVDQLELSEARKELDDRHRILNLAERLSHTGYWTLDPATGEVYWSPEVYVIHGVKPGEFEPGYDDALDFYIEDDRAMIRDLVAAGVQTGEGWSFDATLVRRDGLQRSVHSIAECQKDASGRVVRFYGVFKDLTDERAAVAKAVERERRYRLLADHARDVIAVYGLDGRFTYLSPSVFELVGYTPQELVGRTPYDLIDPDDHDRVRAAFAAAAISAETLTVEYRIRTRSGETRWLEARPRFHRDGDGKILEITDAVRDVTKRREREEALAKANAAAEAAVSAKSNFLAHMSHEIRTPMNGVIGFAELLAGTALTTEQRRYVEMIADSSGALMRLLNDILDLSKVEAGEMEVSLEPVDIRHKLRSIVRLMEPAAAAKNVSISLLTDDSLPSTIVTDKLRIRQIMLNLLGNAVKFTDEGKISVVVSVAGVKSPELQIEVKDTGVGISPDRLEAIFDRFTQADASIARTRGGSGLGLTITRQITDLLGGTLSVDSEVGHGSRFTVALPLVADLPQIEVTQSPEVAALPLSAQAQKSARVLVVEDHEINQVLMRALCQQLSLEYDIASNGLEAIKLVQKADADGRLYDLVLMDVQMPVMDGFEAVRQLRQIGFGAERLPVVALTAHAFADDINACFASGMQGHLGKPLRKVELELALETYVKTATFSHPGARPFDKHDLAQIIPVELRNRYRGRRDLTLDKLASLAKSKTVSKSELTENLDLLHKLAGTAGIFDEASLGHAAHLLEHSMRTAESSSIQSIVRQGLAELSSLIAADDALANGNRSAA